MLSTKAFSSSANAKEYYSHADYYGEEAKGVWYGNGAKALGLEGSFDAKSSTSFSNILAGKPGDGIELGRKDKDGNINHRPGIDLTFSSPKSFSIQYHVFANGDEKAKLNQARINALHKTLNYIEQSGLVYTRKGRGGIVQEEATKLTFALFTHSTNRNLEPQDHVHCLLANLTKCNDGKYRSVVWDKIFENNKFLGQVFRNELALEVKKLGYEIETKILSDGSSSFELKNIPQSLIDAFSTRRQEIEAICKQLDIKTKEGRDKVVINSRKAKQTISKEKLDIAWREVVDKIKESEKVEKADLSNSTMIISNKIIQVVNDITNKGEQTQEFISRKIDGISAKLNTNDPKIQDMTQQDLARLCLADVTHNKSVFYRQDIAAKALKYSIGKHGVTEVEAGITELVHAKEIIVGKNYQLTSKELIDKETYILKTAKSGIGSYNPIIPKEKFATRFTYWQKDYQGDLMLNKQQIKAIKHVLTSPDKITAIQGLPGVGKSTVLDVVRQMSQKNTIGLRGTAPTASAAKTLSESAGITSNTLHSFLGKYKGYLEGRGTAESLANVKAEYKKAMVFVDEASLVSTNIMHSLIKLSKLLGFRVVLIGDTKQLPAVEAGKPFEQLLSVINSVKLTTIVRQKDEAHKNAVLSAASGNILDTFKIHEHNINQTGNNLTQNAVAEYMALSQKEKESTLIISPTRQHRDEINLQIVKELRKSGNIIGEKYKQEILKPKQFTKADYNFAKSYEVGDIIKFNQKYDTQKIKRGEYLQVKRVNTETNTIVLKREPNYYSLFKLNDIKDIRFNLKPGVTYENKLEVYQKSIVELQQGLKLRITKNNPEYKFVNSETVVIEALNSKNVTLKLEDGQKLTLPISQLKHVDYGYCSTIHSSQGKTADRLIAAISSHKKLNNQKAWLVAISRHRHDISIYMNNATEVKTQLARNSGEVKAAREILPNNDWSK